MNEKEIESAQRAHFSVKHLEADAELPADLPLTPESELNEDLTVALLKDPCVTADAVEQLARNKALIKSRKVRRALAGHPLAPRHVSLKVIREFYTFDLMQFALAPGVAADLKRAADELLISRLASITLGERLSLARRASGRVAEALLLNKESRVWQTALENSRLTEAGVVRTLTRSAASAALVEAISHHSKWSLRDEVRMALLRNSNTPAARALEFARAISPTELREVLRASHLPDQVKAYLEQETGLQYSK